MTLKELEALGWEFDGEAPAQYGLRSKKDPTTWDFIVAKKVADAWESVRDIYSYISWHRYAQGKRDGHNELASGIKKLLSYK